MADTEDSKIDSMIRKQLELTEAYLVEKYKLQVKKEMEDIKRDISTFRDTFKLGIYNCSGKYYGSVHKEALPILAKIYGVVKIEYNYDVIYAWYIVKFGDLIDNEIARHEDAIKRLREMKGSSTEI